METQRKPKFPNRLRELRRGRQLTQEEAATLTGFSLSAVNRHENGNRSMDGPTMEAYAKLYGVTAYELYVDPVPDDEKPKPREIGPHGMFVDRPRRKSNVPQ